MNDGREKVDDDIINFKPIVKQVLNAQFIQNLSPTFRKRTMYPTKTTTMILPVLATPPPPPRRSRKDKTKRILSGKEFWENHSLNGRIC